MLAGQETERFRQQSLHDVSVNTQCLFASKVVVFGTEDPDIMSVIRSGTVMLLQWER